MLRSTEGEAHGSCEGSPHTRYPSGRFTADRQERLAFAATNPDQDYDDEDVPQHDTYDTRRCKDMGG